MNHFRPDRAVYATAKGMRKVIKDPFALRAQASSDKAGHSKQGNTESGNGEEQTSDLWEGKGSTSSQGDKTQRDTFSLPSALATACKNVTERPGFSNVLCLREVICVAVSLPIECPAICKVQQFYQEVGKERERANKILCYISTHSPLLCLLNSWRKA